MANENEQEVVEESALSAELDADSEAGKFDDTSDNSEAQPADAAESEAKTEEQAEEKTEEQTEAQTEDGSVAEAAAEVLEETKDDETVPLKTYLDDKRKLKEEVANLKGQIQATQTMATQQPKKAVVKTKSPVEIEAESLGIDPDEVQMTGKLWREQDAWKAEEAAKSQATTTQQNFQDSVRQAAVTMTADKMGDGLDYQTIVALGGNLLRAGDDANVRASNDPGQALYDESLAAIQRSGTKEQKASIQLLLKAQITKTTPAEEKLKAEAEAEAKAKAKAKAKGNLSQELDESGNSERSDLNFGTQDNQRLAEFAAETN